MIEREYDNDNYFEITEELLRRVRDMGFWLKVRKEIVRCQTEGSIRLEHQA